MLSDIDRFKALPQRVQDEILDKHRDWNTDHEWWEFVYEQFIEDMTAKGIAVDERRERTYKGKKYVRQSIQFSGFSNQGDGACFDGYVDNWSLVLQDFPVLLQHRNHFEVMHFSWKSSGRYCHENSLDFADGDTYPVYLDHDERDDVPKLRQLANAQLQDELFKAWTSFTDVFAERVKNYCRELYHNLEQEYDYLTSDECILESLNTNDMLDELIKEYHEEHESA